MTDHSDDYPPEQRAAIKAFRETALEMARWHLTRTEGFEHKAANLLVSCQPVPLTLSSADTSAQ